MANTMRWRYGETSPVRIPVDSDTVIEIGDLVWQATDEALPASAQTDQGTTLANQQTFHNNFAGVAMGASRDGDSEPIRVATTGVFEFDCDSEAFEVGNLIGAAANSGDDGLENQKVDLVIDVGAAIGRCAKRVDPADTRVLVDIVSSVMKGGPQPVA